MSTKESLGNVTIKLEKPDSESNKLERVTKSSSEILTELFGVFNAKPPEIKDSAVKHKKSKKSKKKHKKEKKKKKSKRHSDSDSTDSEDSDHEKKKVKKEKKDRSRKRQHSRDEIPLTPPRRSTPSPSRKRQKRHSIDDDVKRRVKIDPDTSIVISKDNIRHKDKYTKDRKISPVRYKVKKEVKEETIDIPVPNEADVSTIKLPEDKLETQKAAADSTTHQECSDKSGKGKIQIKNLKFSSVFEATVKQAEEQARKKAELFEDGEISDTSLSSESGDELDNNPEFPKSRDPGGILKGDLREIIASREEKRASERKRSRSRERKKSSEKIHHSSDKVSSSSRSRKRSRSKSKTQRNSRSRERESKHSDSRSHHRSHRSHSRRRSSSKSRHSRHARSRSPTSDGVKLGDTEKRRLLEVARRNALSMLRKGTAPIAYQQANKKLLAAIKSGGKSVDELTDFCKHLSKKEALGELSSLSSGDSELGSDNEDTMAFHHPFLVRDKGPIIMNIRGGVALPVKQSGPLALLGQNKEELVQQFPVSSGNDHRVKASEWVPVSPPPSKPPAAMKSKRQEVTHKETEKKLTAAIIAASAPQPVPHVPGPVCLPSEAAPTSSTPATTSALAAPGTPATAPPPTSTPAMAGFTAGAGTLPHYNMAPIYGGAPNYSLSTVLAAVPVAVPGPQAYPPGITPPQDTQIVDIGSIVSQRLSAIRKLQETCATNEARVNAISQIGWRNSDSNFGQFKGSTGAQILTPRELARGSQAWAKKDQLQRAAPVAGGMGMHLLQKMGWQPGQGLGKQGNGSLQPLLLEIKLDTKGLVAREELKPLRPHRRAGGGAGSVARASATSGAAAGGKHPVSMLGEYCSKNRHGAPEYTLCFECGPDHKKNFLFKVKVGGVEYQPSIASANKKQAKSDAAQIALQKLGIIT